MHLELIAAWFEMLFKNNFTISTRKRYGILIQTITLTLVFTEKFKSARVSRVDEYSFNREGVYNTRNNHVDWRNPSYTICTSLLTTVQGRELQIMKWGPLLHT